MEPVFCIGSWDCPKALLRSSLEQLGSCKDGEVNSNVVCRTFIGLAPDGALEFELETDVQRRPQTWSRGEQCKVQATTGGQGLPDWWEPVRFDRLPVKRSGPVPVWAGTKLVQIQNLNLNSKK